MLERIKKLLGIGQPKRCYACKKERHENRDAKVWKVFIAFYGAQEHWLQRRWLCLRHRQMICKETGCDVWRIKG